MSRQQVAKFETRYKGGRQSTDLHKEGPATLMSHELHDSSDGKRVEKQKESGFSTSEFFTEGLKVELQE